MSVEAQSWAFEVSGVSATQKLVLLVLANHAGHDGSNAWPAVSTIARKSCLSERRVISALGALETLGLVERVSRPGRSSIFNLNLKRTTPDGASPLTERHPCRSVTPPLTERHPTPDAPSPNPSSNHPVTVQREAQPANGTRLPKDWEPSEQNLEYCRRKRPDLSPADVAENFRDYWLAVPGAKGRKTDWDRTWNRWVREERKNGTQTRQPGRETTREFAERMARIAAGHPG